MQGHARLEELHRGAPYWDEHGAFADELDQLARVVRELRRHALDIRITPVRRVLERLPRVAQDLARELGKRVRVELHGEEVEVDRAVLDHLDDSLLHLVRNAIDHGLEAEPERRTAGKDPVGTLRLRASRVAGRLQLRLEEDGRGIDVEKVRKRAIERGLLLEMVAEDLPAGRILEFIFEPGISTRDSVSDISGRGVGLDAVKRQVEALGGTIAVESGGSGTAFLLICPRWSPCSACWCCRSPASGSRCRSRHRSRAPPRNAVERAGRRVLHAEGGAAAARRPGAAARSGADARDRRLRDRARARGFKLGLLVDRVIDDLEVFVREHRPLRELVARRRRDPARRRARVPARVGSLVENFREQRRRSPRRDREHRAGHGDRAGVAARRDALMEPPQLHALPASRPLDSLLSPEDRVAASSSTEGAVREPPSALRERGRRGLARVAGRRGRDLEVSALTVWPRSATSRYRPQRTRSRSCSASARCPRCRARATRARASSPCATSTTERAESAAC
jgi:hypothetical protein